MMNANVLTIARNDFRLTLRDGRFRFATVVMVLMLGASGLTGFQEYRLDAERRARAAALVRQQWLNQGEDHPHGGAHFGVYVFKGELPLASIDPGLKPYVGAFLSLETHKRDTFRERPIEDATSAIRFGQLTPAAVMQLLIPLIVIFIGYGAISAEREAGTLQQLMAAGVTPVEIASGKMLFVVGALLSLLAPVALAEGLIIFLLSAGEGVASNMMRLLMMCLFYLLYFLVFAFVSIAVSARVRSSQTSLVILLAFWIGNSLLLPRAASSLAETLAPTPAPQQFQAAIEKDILYGMEGEQEPERERKQLIDDTLKQYGVSRIEDLPVGYAGVMLKNSDARFERVFERHFSRLYATYSRQRQLHHTLSILGPFIAMRETSRGMAGMDIAHYDHFARAAEAYRRMFVERTNDAAEHWARGTGWELKVGRDFWESVPPFAYQTPDWKWALAQNHLSILVLILWATVSGCAAVWSASRISAI
jgi:ABC-2 type transport system permease protein